MAAWVHLLVENCHCAVLAGGDWSNDAGSRDSQAGEWHDKQRSTALLAKCPGPDSMPRKRENPEGKKAEQTKNKCEWKGSAKAPLHGLVAAGVCLWPKASWGAPRAEKAFPTTGFVLSSSPQPCHAGSCLPREVVDKGQPLTSALGTVRVLQRRVCTVILCMGRPLTAAAPSPVDSLTVVPRFLAGSLQSYGLHGKMLTQQVGRAGGKA